MNSAERCAAAWFGNAQLGDKRRTLRLVEMAHRALSSPAGRVTQVFCNAAERQGAYDLLEHDSVSTKAVAEALFVSTANASRTRSRILVPIDGTSLQMVDDVGTKGFGHIGAFYKGAHGLKVINALALTWEGVPIGLAEQIWWLRQGRANGRGSRPGLIRESVRWEVAVAQIVDRYAVHAPNTTLHFLGDREADATRLLQQLMRSGQEFTIRSNATRRILAHGQRRHLLRALKKRRPVATMEVSIPASPKRVARIARLKIRAALMPIVWRDRQSGLRHTAPLTVVWATEGRRSSPGIEWVLFTNVPTTNGHDACDAVRRYTHRWRIEDFHKTWKTGVCNVEDTQLRSPNAVIKWATILGAVATRIERLRRRCREEPTAAATCELSTGEIEALIFLRSETAKIAVASIDHAPTIVDATAWIAELGGYVNTRRSAPPGATTLSRGFERLQLATELMANLRAAGRLR
jgi:hypothetical protein